MDDMIELMDANGLLGRRLEAYAEFRLSPDLATTRRLRARVLAVAHRQASLARADAALSVLPQADGRTSGDLARDRGRAPARHRSRRWSRAAGAFPPPRWRRRSSSAAYRLRGRADPCTRRACGLRR